MPLICSIREYGGAMPFRRAGEGRQRRLAVRSILALAVVCGLGGSSPPEAKQPAGGEASAVQHSQAAPRPGNLDAEARHVAVYDAALKPVRSIALSEEDAKRIRSAFDAASDSDLIGAKSLAGSLKDPAARKLVEWYVLFRGLGSADDYRTFLAANPSWPELATLRARQEMLAFEAIDKPAVASAILGTRTPETGVGLAAIAAIALARGDKSEATKVVRQAWREEDFSAGQEKVFLERFGKLLRLEDHKWRIDRLLGSYVRWRAQRLGRVAAATRMLALLPNVDQEKVKARIAAFQEARNARALLKKLPADKNQDWGLEFNRVQFLRRTDDRKEVRKILLSVPTDPKIIANFDGWWHERYLAALDVMKSGDFKTAYALVANPGPLGTNQTNDQAFFAGWLALRHLDAPKQALAHFQVLAQNADGPLSRSRASYWLGRTYDQLGDKQKARAAYQNAASVTDTFDSHLARLKLEPGARKISVTLPEAPTPAQISRFNALDSVRAAIIATKAGLPPHTARRFLNSLRLFFDSEAELAMLAHLAEALGDTQSAVRIGKTANARGHNLIVYSYPVHAFPAYSPLRPPPETAMLLGIARQESEFNTLTQSGAGARGLLQVMPITARHVCRDYKLKCNIARLLTDKAYNTTLASAYIADRMDEFDGNYVLTIAGYNAGPGRVRQWVREFGDPRRPGVDPIDWIHRIPFEETRLYVQKVLSNLQMYRARLASEPTTIRLGRDLARVAAQPSDGAKMAGE